MDKLLEVRENILKLYRQNEMIASSVLKLTMYLFIYLIVFDIGHYSDKFSVLFEGVTGTVFFGMCVIASAFLHSWVSHWIVSITAILGMSQYTGLMIFSFIMLLIIMSMYGRYAIKERSLIFITVIMSHLGLFSFAPILAGLFFAPTAVIAIFIGASIYNGFVVSSKIIGYIGADSVVNTAEQINLLTNNYTGEYTWIVVASIFSIAILAMHIIRKMPIKNNYYIAILVGGTISFIALIVKYNLMDINIEIFAILVDVLSSVLFVAIIKFFSVIVDFKKMERVQYEDDENIYYVTVMPKYLVDDEN